MRTSQAAVFNRFGALAPGEQSRNERVRRMLDRDDPFNRAKWFRQHLERPNLVPQPNFDDRVDLAVAHREILLTTSTESM
jgi:hypothetical protein